MAQAMKMVHAYIRELVLFWLTKTKTKINFSYT